MPSDTATRLILALAIAIAAREVRAQEPPLLEPPAPEETPAPAPPRVKPSDHGPTRLFLAPTGRSLPRGNGAIGVTEIGVPWGEVGVSNRVSVLVGSVVPFGVVGIAPKVQLLGGRRVQAAIGAFQLFGSSETGGIGYGVVTLGSADVAATIGYAYGYGAVADSGGSPSLVFFGVEKAIGSSLRLIVEGYVGGAAMGMPEETFLGGFRICHGRWGVDLGVVVPVYETGAGTPVPLVTITWAF